MSAADEYREHAEACLQAARLTLREDVRSMLVDMAHKWNDAAARWERNAAQISDSGEVSPSEQDSPQQGDGPERLRDPQN